MKRARRPEDRSRRRTARIEMLPAWKKILFAALTVVLLLALLEGVLALVGIKPILYQRDPYVGFSGKVPLFVKGRDATGKEIYVTAQNQTRTFNAQQFPAHKSRNAVRIFCMGGSTTYGHPYDDTTSFCGWLRAMLPKADPSRQWELVNCGGISYASYRVALLMEELVRYQPDLFIIYTGQNEFLEQRTYSQLISTPKPIRGVMSLANRTRIVTAARTLVEKLKPAPAMTTNVAVLPGEPRTLLEGGVAGPEAYERDDPWQRRVVEHCRFNLNRMVDIAHAAGAQVIFVTPASNLRNCSPFKSQNRAGLAPAEFKSWQSLAVAAERAYSAGDLNAALAAAERALAIDSRHAGVHYLRGRALWQLQRFDEARKEFIRAKDEDVCPLRALTSIVDAVRDVAAQRQVPVVDFVEMIDVLTEHQTPGDDWFLDHVHPTIDGNFRLARALVSEIARGGFARIDGGWNDAAADAVKKSVETKLDQKAHGTAICNVAKVMAWAGKYEDAYRAALRAKTLSPADAAIEFEVGKNAYHLRRYDEAIRHLKATLALNPRFVEAHLLLANALGAQGDFAQGIVACRAGLELRSSDAGLHLTLGNYLSRIGQTNEAIAEVRQTIRLAPDNAEAHSNLGWLLKDTGQPTEALEHFREAVRLKPGLITARLGLAWLLAAHPDAHLRDPQRAIGLSEQMADGSHFGNWMVLDTLGVSYAAAGRFDDAVRVQQQALNLVRQNSPAYEAAVHQRLNLFQQHQPFRENAR